jgi:hypothetical protein
LLLKPEDKRLLIQKNKPNALFETKDWKTKEYEKCRGRGKTQGTQNRGMVIWM